MGRTGHLWKRKGRPGWWAEVNGKVRNFGLDKKEADRAYHRAKSEITLRAAGAYSVPDLVEIYLEWVSERVKPKTYKNYYEALQVFARDNSKIHPSELRAFHLTRWLESKKQWNPSTRKTQGSAVKIWSSWLDAEGYTDGDRLRNARLPESLKRDAADPDELLRIEHTITDPYFKAFWVVLYDTGARPGEIASLEASAISWSTSTAIVDGKRGQRIIGLSVRCLDVLKIAVDHIDAGPLLRTSRGAIWSENVRRNHMEKWKSRCNPRVSEGITLYHCRHDLYRRWHAAGISDILISKQMGHTLRGAPSLTLLASTYGHPDTDMLAKAAAQASQKAPTLTIGIRTRSK